MRVFKNLSKKIILSVLIVLAFSYAGSVYAATFNVPGDFATIQEAIDDAGTVNGDIINIGAGTHIEAAVRITKELIIQGQGIGVTILDPSSISANVVQFFVDADNVTIQDMTIQNALQAIRFEMAGMTIDSTTLFRVSMLNNTSRGIEVHNATTVTNLFVDQCNFENTNHGLRLASSGHLDGVTFSNSTFTDNVIGIYVANDGSVSTMANMMVSNCTFSNHTAGFGIFLEEAQDTIIEDNTFQNNRRDIQLFKWYQPSVEMSNVFIRDNTMIGTTDAIFAIFNAEDNGQPTVFNNIRFLRNNADSTADGSAVYAGAHKAGPPSAGGTGWNTVRVRDNCFKGITTAGRGVRFFLPAGIAPDDALGGDDLNVVNNWWGSSNLATITALMENPTITDFQPFRNTDICGPAFFSLQPLSPSYPGIMNTINITGGIPNGDVLYGYGITEGPFESNGSQEVGVQGVADDICEDFRLGIADFTELGTVTGDEFGNSAMPVFVPNSLLGFEFFIQALDLSTCISSDLIMQSIVQAGSNIMHLPIDPGVAGVGNIISATGILPNGNVRFHYGFFEQIDPADDVCPGFQSGILNPRLLSFRSADGAGNSSILVSVPANIVGITVVFQAVDLSSCTGSNVVSETF